MASREPGTGGLGAKSGGVRWWLRLSADHASAAQAKRDVQKALKDATNPKEAERNIKRVKKETQDLGGSLRGLGSLVGGLFAGFSFVAIIHGLVAVNREFERFIARLTTLQGSRGAALQTFSWIEKFATDTPFQIGEITDAFISLRTIGLQPTEQMMTRLGNHASAFGQRIDQLAHAVVRASTGEMEMLKSFGVTARVQGDQITFSFRGVTQTVRRNSADIIKYLEEVSEKNFAGSMEREMDTLNGAISNVEDSIQNIARAIGASGLNQYLREVALNILSVTDQTYSNRRAIAAWTQGVINGIRLVAKTFLALASTAKNIGEAIGEAMVGAFHNMAIDLMEVVNKAIPFSRFDPFSEEDFAQQRDLQRRRFKGALENIKEIGRAWDRAGQAAADFYISVTEPTVPARMPSVLPPGRDEAGTGTGAPPKRQKSRLEQIGDETNALEALGKIRRLTADELARLNRLEAELQGLLAKSPGVTERADIEGTLSAITDTRKQQTALAQAQEFFKRFNPFALMANVKDEVDQQALVDKFRDQARLVEDAWTSVAHGVSNTWAEALGMMIEDGASAGDILGAIFRGIGGSMLGGLAQFASGKVAENIALAFENKAKAAAAFASFNPASGVGYLAASKGNWIAAAKWGLLAGVASAAQGAVSGGGAGGTAGGIPSGARDPFGRLAQDRNAALGKIIIVVDGIDPENPRHQRLQAESVRNARERGYEIDVQSRRAS